MIYPILKPYSSNTFVLVEDYTYEDIKVTKGFETNGADIPRILWSIVPPFKPKYLPAVVIHDYLIKVAITNEDIIVANYYFEKILLEIENSFKTRAMINAVRLYWKIKIKLRLNVLHCWNNNFY